MKEFPESCKRGQGSCIINSGLKASDYKFVPVVRVSLRMPSNFLWVMPLDFCPGSAKILTPTMHT